MRALPVVLLLLALVGAGAATAEDVDPAWGSGLADAQQRFAWDLYDALRSGEDNLFFSPYSVSTALLMTREGAGGTTAAQMDEALHLHGVDRARGHQQMVRDLEPPPVREGRGEPQPAYRLDIANRLFGQEGYGFLDAFTSTLDRVYKAPLARVDFRDQAKARRVINDWVASRTEDRIQDIVPPGMPPPLTRLALANAIYYKAQWQDAFQERSTKDAEFTGPGGKKAKAPFMRRVGSYGYAEVDGLQLLEIPYRERRTSMVVFLPRAVDGLPAVEARIAKGEAAAWLKKLGGATRVDVRLPRFRFTCAKDLTPVLPRLGMTDAFDPDRADFSGMTKTERLCIGAVLHKAFVAVDEKGTEATAATVVMMKLGAAAPNSTEPIAFTADHPFAFVIRHRASGAIMFAGRLNMP